MLQAEDYLFSVLRKRLQHLQVVAENPTNPEVLKDYFLKRLNRIVVDYLLRETYFDSAKKFVEENHMKVGVSSDVLGLR